MMKYPYTMPSLLTSWLLLGLLAGCSTPATQYYVLDTLAADRAKPATEARAVPSVAIRQLEIPHYLDRPRMVSRDVGNQLRIAEYHQWGGRLRDNIARTLADNLAGRLGTATVSAAPLPGSMDAELVLLVDIRQFERQADGRIHLKVQWHVQRQGAGTTSYLEHLQSDKRVDADDYDGMAVAMSRLLARFSDHMAAVVRQGTE